MFNDFNIKFPQFKNALCRQTGFGDLWFPETREEVSTFTPQAKKICARCSHRVECLDFALEEGIQDGIWGGLSRRDRLKLLPVNRHKKRVSPIPEKVYKYRQAGYSYSWIANRLLITEMTAMKSYERYKKRMGQGGEE